MSGRNDDGNEFGLLSPTAPSCRPSSPNSPPNNDDEAFSKIMAGAGVLGAPTDEQGLGDEQATRILMLLARTGRRMNEILLLDRDPLLPLDTPAPEKPDGFVAKLHYQQTKIVEGPDTIPVDQEIVAIVRAQQEWSDRFLAGRAAPGRQGKYLFLAARKNRNGDRPYGMTQLHTTLSELVGRLDVRDSTGRLVDFQRTHRFRHTKATSLLNAGVPLHVVQRYLGHLSPTMTMIYAQTLASTHEREFLRYLPQTHRRRPRTRRRPPRPLRHDPAEQAHRPDPAQRLLPAATPPNLRQGQRLPDLRQVRHRRDLPARADHPTSPNRAAH